MKNYKSRFLRLAALLLSLLLLCGCGTPGGSGENIASTDDTTLTENTATIAEPSSPTDPIASEPQQPEAKFYPADLTANVTLPEYDPQRTVYFDCHGWDYDFYPNGSHCYIRFYILTKEEYALEDIQVSLPLESAYTAEPYQQPLFHMPERPEDTHWVYGGMPYHVYQTYQGVDWAELADLWLAAEKAKLEIEAGWPNGYIMNEPPAEVIPLEQTIEAYKSALNANLETYRALTEEDLSDYYCYIVAINFDLENLVEETCETIDITLGETTYTENIGQIRIHADYKPSAGTSRGIEKYLYTAAFTQHNPWGGGLAQGAGHIFEATDDLTLLGFHVEGMDAEVVGAQVTISQNGYEGLSSYDDAYQWFKWDLKTPLEIADGCGVHFDLVISSPEWTKFEHGGFADIYLDYEARGEQYSYRLPADMTRDRAAWETAAIVFDNLDIASYYTDYYIPCGETWREMIA